MPSTSALVYQPMMGQYLEYAAVLILTVVFHIPPEHRTSSSDTSNIS